MLKPFAAAAFMLAAMTVGVGCGSQPSSLSRVLIISVDGLRPDLLLRGSSPEITALMRRGSYTLLASTVPEVYTVPSHVSMLTGVRPARHGVTWDHHVEDSYPHVSTLFELARSAGYSTALVTAKTKLIVLTKPGTLDWSHVGHEGREDDLAVASQAVAMLRDHRPEVMFIHFGGVDIQGHATGWGSPEQLQALQKVDRSVGLVLGALDDSGAMASTLVILTGDHGGAGLLHDPKDALSQRIPWIAAGPAIRKDFDLSAVPGLTIDTMATFATACAALGIRVPDVRDGKAVSEIFETPAAAVMR
jgi:predicted AlkP superfamily pyrophosphatase or phosphodiesterase